MDSLVHKRFSGGPPRGVAGSSLCTQGAQTSGLPLGSERALSGNEDRQHFGCATWLHKAREMPKEQFKRWGAPS
jgi:hypothetical protein